MGKIKRKNMLKVFAAVFLGSLLIAPASFAEENRMPDITQNTGNLTVSFASEKKGEKVPIDGADISVYEVAQLNTHGGSADFGTLQKYVSAAGEIIDIKDTADSERLAQKIDKIKSEKTATSTTDKEGNAYFKNLPAGMYLVSEEGKKGSAEKYESFSPYLITVPLAENGAWTYDVSSAPKTTPKELSESPKPEVPNNDTNLAKDHSTTDTPTRVKTGDENRPLTLLLEAVLSMAAASMAYVSIRKRKGKS